MAIGGSLMSIGTGFLIPSLMLFVTTNNNWRSTYVLLAYICWFFMFPIGVIFYREKPEAYGYLPDGQG